MSNLTDFLSLSSSAQPKEIGETLLFLTSANVGFAEPVYADDNTFVLDGQYFLKSQYPNLYSIVTTAGAELCSKDIGLSGLDSGAVEYGNGVWVTIDANGRVRTSTNISSSAYWITGVDVGSFAAASGVKINYTNGLFLTSETTNSPVLSSTNGITWFSRTSGAGTNNIFSVIYGNGVYVYVGGAGIIGSSTDSITWTARASGTTNGISDVKYGIGKFLFVSSPNLIGTSTDGITWTSSTTLFTGNHNKLIYENGLFIIGGDSGNLGTSTDGINWRKRTSGTGSSITGLAYGNGIYVYSGVNGAMGTSTDAITWTSTTSHTSTNIIDVKFGNGQFVYVGINGLLRTSTNVSILQYSEIFDIENYFYLPKITKSNYTVVPQTGPETQIAFRSFYKAST